MIFLHLYDLISTQFPFVSGQVLYLHDLQRKKTGAIFLMIWSKAKSGKNIHNSLEKNVTFVVYYYAWSSCFMHKVCN